jgi:hypothetical protein
MASFDAQARSSSLFCSMFFRIRMALSAGPIAGGRSAGLWGESDGKAKYVDAAVRGGLSAEQAVYREKLREDRIRGLGLGIVRWGWADVENPDRLGRKLLAAGLRPRIRG